MSVSSGTKTVPLQEWTDSRAAATIFANRARLAQLSAEHAFRTSAPQALPSDGARRNVAQSARVFVDRHFRRPVRMVDLCNATGVGARTVQRCFRQRFGVSVTSYLRAVRLDAAYDELIAAHPSRDSVTTIALHNGFNHLGRFSSDFRERFGQLPSETLRSAPVGAGGSRWQRFLDLRATSFSTSTAKN